MLHAILSRILHKIAWIAPGGGSLRPWIQTLRGVNIGHNVWIGQMVYLDELHPESLTIGDNCTIGLRTSIFTHIYWGSRKEDNPGRVIIEKDVYIGPHCVILPNVRIGEGAVIKAGTVVTRNVPAHSFFGPPPAQVLGEVTVPLTSEHSYEEFVRGMRVRNK
jgi:acetyltransferase-like isoleucine patch superfamily enzyme